MSYSSGTFSLVAGNPVVTGTTVSSTWANNTLNDIATGLSTCLLKDGTQTTTAAITFAHAFTSAGLTSTVATPGGLTQSTATAMTSGLQNSWADTGGYLASGYRKDSQGWVQVEGMVTAGTATADTLIFTFPSGYRPADKVVFSTSDGNSSGEFNVLANGQMTVRTATNGVAYSLSNIRFKAA